MTDKNLYTYAFSTLDHCLNKGNNEQNFSPWPLTRINGCSAHKANCHDEFYEVK